MTTNNVKALAFALHRTAQGDAFHGKELRDAKNMPCVGAEGRCLLDRCSRAGAVTFDDRMALQRLAIKISKDR